MHLLLWKTIKRNILILLFFVYTILKFNSGGLIENVRVVYILIIAESIVWYMNRYGNLMSFTLRVKQFHSIQNTFPVGGVWPDSSRFLFEDNTANHWLPLSQCHLPLQSAVEKEWKNWVHLHTDTYRGGENFLCA